MSTIAIRDCGTDHRSKHELPRREQGETSDQVDVNWVKKSRSNSMSST